jgi:4-amino-4-deoxy-L-arabinose transferase-like glycosyltransferase
MALLTVLGASLVYEAKRTGLTIDEPSHFAAAYMYWLGQDVLVPADSPPLTRMIAGWVPLLRNAPDPRRSKYWASKDAYLIGSETLGIAGKVGRRMLFYTRLPFIVFPLGICFLCWYWGRILFGEGVALILAACAALEPTVLGHGPLINSDVPAAFVALWCAYAMWTYWRRPTPGRLVFMTLTLFLALITKFTLLPLLVIGYGVALWRAPRLSSAILIPSALYCGLLVASQFQARPLPEQKVAQFEGAGLPHSLQPIAAFVGRLPWPSQFIEGLLYIGGSLQGRGFTGYMLGHKIEGRVPGYFPFAWIVKFPIPLQLLMAAGLTELLLRICRRRVDSADAVIWGIAAVLFGLAVMSNFHIGFRHVLPVLPFLILGGGAALKRCLGHRLGRLVIAAGVAFLALSSLLVYPHGIAYFNEWIGGPTYGWKYLADSNIDWGQNYPELGAYLARHPVEVARVFLVSFDNPWHYMQPGSLSPQLIPPDGSSPVFQPAPGTYAISVNLLTGVLLPSGHEDYLAKFRRRVPTARAGYSILIYVIK